MMILFDREKHQKIEKAKASRLKKSPKWLRKKQSGICFHCHKNVGPLNLSMDHLIPVSLGGHSDLNNVVPSCKDCNNIKKNRTPAEWALFKKSSET